MLIERGGKLTNSCCVVPNHNLLQFTHFEGQATVWEPNLFVRGPQPLCLRLSLCLGGLQLSMREYEHCVWGPILFLRGLGFLKWKKQNWFICHIKTDLHCFGIKILYSVLERRVKKKLTPPRSLLCNFKHPLILFSVRLVLLLQPQPYSCTANQLV